MTRSILELSAAALQSTVGFIAFTATSRMARQANCKSVKISARLNFNQQTEPQTKDRQTIQHKPADCDKGLSGVGEL